MNSKLLSLAFMIVLLLTVDNDNDILEFKNHILSTLGYRNEKQMAREYLSIANGCGEQDILPVMRKN